MVGVNQRGKVFQEKLHRRFSEKAPESSANVEGRYSLRSADSVQKHVKNFYTDAQKIAKPL